MHWIKDVKYVKEYQLQVRFENGECMLIDLRPHLEGKIFKPLKDIAYFKTVKLNEDIDTIVWSNNADFSPDFLYEIGQPIKK